MARGLLGGMVLGGVVGAAGLALLSQSLPMPDRPEPTPAEAPATAEPVSAPEPTSASEAPAAPAPPGCSRPTPRAAGR